MGYSLFTEVLVKLKNVGMSVPKAFISFESGADCNL